MTEPPFGGTERRTPDREQKLIVFFAVDVVNGTAFKARHGPQRQGDRYSPATWPLYFNQFFRRVIVTFREEVASRGSDLRSQVTGPPTLWKLNGDELIFRELLLPRDRNHDRLALLVESFIAAVTAVDRNMIPLGTGLRGCVWTVGFPIRNKEIRGPSRTHIPVIRPRSYTGGERDYTLFHADAETGMYRFDDFEGFIEYVGPDMDLGFRLTAQTPPGRISASLDVAYLLREGRHTGHINVFRAGWAPLKGIAAGNPYPLLFLNTEGHLAPRLVWERDNPEIQRLTALSAMSETDIDEFAETMWEQLPEHFIKPYTSFDNLTPPHHQYWQDFELENLEKLTLDAFAGE